MKQPDTEALAKARDLTNGSIGRQATLLLARALRREAKRRGESSDAQAIILAAARILGIKEDEGIRKLAALPASGMIQRTDDGLRILVRGDDSPGRRNFTIVHELAHGHIFNNVEDVRDSSAEMERRCDVFAGEFLMPRKDFRWQHRLLLATGPVKAARELGRAFGVSFEACVVRSSQLRLYKGRQSAVLLAVRRKSSVWKVERAAYDTSLYANLIGQPLRELGLEPTPSMMRSLRKTAEPREDHGVVILPLLRSAGKGLSERLPSIIQYVWLGVSNRPQDEEEERLGVGFDLIPIFAARDGQQVKLTL